MTIAFILRDWHSIGGIQRNAVELCQASCDLGHKVIQISRLSEWWKVWQCDVIVIGHVNLLPLAFFAPSKKIMLIIYGIEAWKRVGLIHRLGLWRVSKVIAISEYTWQQAKPFLGEKPYVILPCTC